MTNYENFSKRATLNDAFEVVPTNTQLLAIGASVDEKGNMHYEHKTYSPDAKLEELPKKMQVLFTKKQPAIQTDNKLANLSDILFTELNSVVNPGEKDVKSVIQRANTVCNVADKIIAIADLSIKAETLNVKKKQLEAKWGPSYEI